MIVEAAGLPTIETFKTSYQTMKAHFPKNKDIQLFGGGLVMSEFNDDTENIYAGHLGGFWTPPFYSSPNGGQVKITNDWRKSFNAFPVFYNYSYRTGISEQPSNPAAEAFWYPSKIVMTKNYSGVGGETSIRSAKVALPETRGFGLKMTVTNKSPTSSSLGVLMLNSLPTFESLKQWDSKTQTGWNWMQSPSFRNQTNSYFDSGENIVVIEDSANSAYLAAGLSEIPDSWGLDENYSGNNYSYPLFDQFHNKKGGHLSNSDDDNDGNGTTFGLVSQAPPLAQNQSHTFSLIVGMGSTKEEAMNIVRTYRNKDIEAEADNYWNQRLNTLFSSLPAFQSNDETLNRIYQNSALTYLINKWPIFNNFETHLAGFSQSSSFFPWMMGIAGYFPLADAPSWKEQLKKVLTMDFTNCRAFDPVSGIHLCDHGYAYNKVSIVDGVYRYITSTSDFGFLDEIIAGQSILQRISDLTNQDDKLEYGSDHLANYGSDNVLYEYNIHCDYPENQPLRGKYTGIVVSPNAERVIVHREVGNLAEKKGDSSLANAHYAKAEQIKTGLQTLWNPSAGWFDSISLYDLQTNPRSVPLRNTFWGMYPLLLLQYDNLLTDEQKTGILSNIGQFRGNYGLTSVSNNLRDNWCGRTDWHGPGLYSGATGVVLTGLFKNGQESLAYDLLSPIDGKGYAYLARMPYFSQAFPSDFQTVGLLPGFMEGLSLGQSLIEGMFGVSPNTKQTKIAPHIPVRLLQKGPVSLKGIKAQGHIWDVSVNDAQNQTLNLAVSGAMNGTNADHFRFEYEMKGILKANISRLMPNKTFAVTATPFSGGNNIVVQGTSDTNGMLTINLPLNGYYLISGYISSATPIITTLTIDDQVADITGQSQLDLHLTPSNINSDYIDIPVVVTYSSGSSRYLSIRFNYQPVTPIPTSPVSFGNFKATAKTPGSYTFTWDRNLTNTKGYLLRFNKDPQNDWTGPGDFSVTLNSSASSYTTGDLNTVNACYFGTSHDDEHCNNCSGQPSNCQTTGVYSGLSCGSNYVVTIQDLDNGVRLEPVQIACTALKASVTVPASCMDDGQATLSWNAVDGAVSYFIRLNNGDANSSGWMDYGDMGINVSSNKACSGEGKCQFTTGSGSFGDISTTVCLKTNGNCASTEFINGPAKLITGANYSWRIQAIAHGEPYPWQGVQSQTSTFNCP